MNPTEPLQTENALLHQRIAELEQELAETRQQHAQCQHTLHLLQTVVDHMPGSLFIKDCQGTMLLSNRHVAQVFQLDPQHIVGMHERELFPQAKVDTWQAEDQHLLATGETVVTEETIIKNGEPHIHLVTRFPIYDASNTIVAIGSYSTDITPQKLDEQALRHSEQKFRTIADFTCDWDYWLAPDGSYLYISPACERVTGYRPDELQAHPELLAHIIHPEDRERVMNKLARTMGKSR